MTDGIEKRVGDYVTSQIDPYREDRRDYENFPLTARLYASGGMLGEGRKAGEFHDDVIGMPFEQRRNEARDMSVGHRASDRQSFLRMGENVGLRVAGEVGRSFGVMTGLVPAFENLWETLPGFRQQNDEWTHPANFSLDGQAGRFNNKDGGLVYKGLQGIRFGERQSLNYAIDPSLLRQVEGKEGLYLTFDSVPKELQDVFLEVVENPTDALRFFEQVTGAIIYSELSSAYGVDSFRDMTKDMTTPDMVAEDLLLFGFLNIGGRAIKFGKNMVKARNTTVAKTRSGRILFGDDAVKGIADHGATAITDRRGMIDAARSAALTEKSGAGVVLGSGAIFTGTDVLRQEQLAQRRNLTQDQNTIVEGILFSSVIGLGAGSLIKHQVNQGIPSETIYKLVDDLEMATHRQREIIAREKGVDAGELTPDQNRQAQDAAMAEVAEAASKLGVDLNKKDKALDNESLGEAIVTAIDHFKQKVFPFTRGPEAIAASEAADNNAAKVLLGKLGDDTSRTEGQRTDPATTEVVQFGKELRYDFNNAMTKIDDMKLTPIAPGKRRDYDENGNLTEVTADHTDEGAKWVAGELIGEMAMDADLREITDELIQQAFSRGNISIEPEQFELVREAVSNLRNGITKHVQNMVKAGYLNPEITDINPYHVARLWDPKAVQTLEATNNLKALFSDYYATQHYRSLIEKVKARMPEGEEFLGPEEFPEGKQLSDVLNQMNPATRKVFNKTIEGEADHAVSTISGPLGYNTADQVGDRSARSDVARSLTIPNNYSVTLDGGDVIRVTDYIKTHPEDILTYFERSAAKPALMAGKNINSEVPRMRAEAARLLNEGDVNNAHNYNVAAQLIEILDLVGEPELSARVEGTIRTLMEHDDRHRAALELSDAILYSTNKTASNSERYQLAEAVVLDALLGQSGQPNSVVARLTRNAIKDENLRVKEIEEKHVKDYSSFDKLDIKDPEGVQEPKDILSDETQILVEGNPDLGIDPISKDAGRLIEAHPEARFRQEIPGEKETSFNKVEEERWESNRQDGRTTGQKSLQVREYDTPTGPSEVILDNDVKTSRSRSLPINEPDMVQGRKGRLRTQIDRMHWEPRQLLALREAAHTLFFYLDKAARDEFSNLFIAPPNKVELKYSSHTEAVARRAQNRSEVFMEAVVRYAGGDKQLDDFTDIVSDMDAFRKVVKKYADGFYSPQSRSFLGPRKAARKTKKSERFREQLELNRKEREEIKKEAKESLRVNFARLKDGDIGEVFEGVDPMVFDEAFVHGKPGSNVNKMVRAVANVISKEANKPGRTRGKYLRGVAQGLKEDREQGGRIAESIRSLFEQLDQSRRSYETAMNDFESMRNKAFEGLEGLKVQEYQSFYKDLRKDYLQETRFRAAGEEYFIDDDLVFAVPRLRGSFDSHSDRLNKKAVRQDIISHGRAAARRAENYTADKMRVYKEYLDKNPEGQVGAKRLSEALESLILSVQGRGQTGKNLLEAVPYLEKLLVWGQTAIYATFAITMGLTQFQDLSNAIWNLGIINHVRYNLPSLKKAIMPPSKKVKNARKGKLENPYDTAYDQLSESEYLALMTGDVSKQLFDTFSIQNPNRVLARTINPRTTMNPKNTPVPIPRAQRKLFEEDGIVKKGLHWYGYGTSKFNEWVATTLISLVPNMIQKMTLESAATIMARDFEVALKEITSLDYLALKDMNLSADDFAFLSSRTFRKKGSEEFLAESERLGSVSSEAADLVREFGIEKFIETLGKKRSDSLDRLRGIGWRDHEILQFAQALKEVPGDTLDAKLTNLPEDMRVKFRMARLKFANNQNPIPTDATIPTILKNPLGRSIMAFTRFLTTAGERFLRSANRRGGASAMATSQLFTTAMMTAVETIKSELKGKEPHNPLAILNKIQNEGIFSLSKSEQAFLLRIVNGSGQYGLSFDLLSGVFSRNRYGGGSIPALDFAKDTLSEKGWGSWHEALKRFGLGTFDTAVKHTRWLKEE